MEQAIIIIFCILLLISYVFDITASKTKIPSVILLFFLGWGVKQLVNWTGVHVPDFSPVLPVLGTVGLILIVLEGSLELELHKSKSKLILKAFLGAVVPMIVLALLLAAAFHYTGGYSFKQSVINAIPICVISSAIAIPSVRYLSPHSREFVIYESSLSDIAGVLAFNFLVLNESIDKGTFGYFGLQILIVIVLSFIATVILAYLLSRIEHHIKFIPIILLVILIYAISKEYHLPGLVFILVFGLFIGNVDELKHIKLINKLRPEILDREVKKLKELTIEAAFLIRSLFFLVFGYLIESTDVLNPDTFLWALAIVVTILLLRFIQLKLSGLPLRPLFFIVPRGLITILLFLSINPEYRIPLVNNSLIVQVIIITSLVMMTGLITTKKTVS